MYAQLTTGKPVQITSRTGPRAAAHYFEVQIDTKKNELRIFESKKIDWEHPRGTRVTLEIEGRYQKGRASVDEYLAQTATTMKGSHENTFDGQNESDPLIEDLEVALAALREELHVRAENAGSVVGPLVLGDDGDRVDCARLGKGGYSVPSIVEPEYIEIRRCTADFVLLVEKGTQWNRLSEDKFWRRY